MSRSARPPLGQHFLRDMNVIKTIVAAAEFQRTETALEIGPGKGILTESVMGKVKRLVAIELDHKLAANLQAKFAHQENVKIIHADFLKVDLHDVIPAGRKPGSIMMDPPLTTAGDDGVKILGNLPYSITSPIFEKLMAWTGWDLGVFLIQREVAERIASLPGSRAYGILSLAVQIFADVETVLQVKPGAFNPPPKVSSTVIRLRRKKTPVVPPEQIDDFFDLVHGAFAHRRKTIANSLAFHSQIPRAEVEKWLLRHNAEPAARAETIGLGEYAKLSVAWSIFRREMNLT
jgi:16S rRNA (adenine1518-N6/adenine1519-N6)-dimethyltransferase